MLPLLLLPISIPAVITMVTGTTGVLTDDFSPIAQVKFLAVYCVVFTTTCFLLFDTVLNAE
jgi:heme exporter protein B